MSFASWDSPGTLGSVTRSNVSRGGVRYTIWNGVLPVDLFCMLLNANSTCAKAMSHYLGWLSLMHLMRFPKVQFVISVWGWFVVLNFNSVENFFHSVFQNWLKNFTSWSKVMDFGTPCNLTIPWKKRLAVFTASEVFLQVKKWAILVYLSTTTKTESNHLWVLGKPSIKSKLRSLILSLELVVVCKGMCFGIVPCTLDRLGTC